MPPIESVDVSAHRRAAYPWGDMTEQSLRPERIQHTVIVPASLDMVAVVGVGDEVLRTIENEFPDVDIHVRGNQITLTGGSADLHLVEQLFIDGIASGELQPDLNPQRAALALLGLCNSVIAARALPQTSSVDDFIEDYARMFNYGVLASRSK